MEISHKPPLSSDKSPEYEFRITYHLDTDSRRLTDVPLTGEATLSMISAPRNYPGYINGFRQPVVRLKVKLRPVSNAALTHFERVIGAYFPSYAGDRTIYSLLDVIQCFGEILCHLQTMAGFPIFMQPQIVTSVPERCVYSVWIPTLFGVWLPLLCEPVLKIFNTHLDESRVRDDELAQQLNNLINVLKQHAPQGSNSLNFLSAAHSAQIPWQHIAVNVFQYGQGKHACWLNSTFTDASSQIGANLAASKLTAHHVLQKAGFPMPKHYVVRNEAEAIACAQQLGFPVVVKPIDGKGGAGVFANLISIEGVRKAWRQISKSTTVMVEKHVTGKDYRLLVFQGQVIWAIERIPAGVTGNGVDTIGQLVLQHNVKHQAIYPLRNIQVTDDTHDYLREQGLNFDSILEKNRFVALNRIANISAGGTPIAVLDRVHPDNIRLAEAAAQLLRLDIAGVDFISPDICESWLDNQATILEINAQPQLGKTTGPHLYLHILKQLIPGQGRIPVIVLCGSPAKTQLFAQTMRELLASHFATIGVASSQGTAVNGNQMLGPLALYTGGTQLLLRRDMEVLIYCITTESEVTLHGLAFDRYHSLFLLDDTLLKWHNPLGIDTLLKACCGKIYISEVTFAKKLDTQLETVFLSEHPEEVLPTWLIELQEACQ